MTDRDEQARRVVELPASTAWPMVVALGVTLGFAGLVTHAAVSIVGSGLALAGTAGWWRQVLPRERHDAVRLRPPEARARPVVPVPDTVRKLVVGEASHRARLPLAIHPYSSGIRGGVAGAVSMAGVAMAYGWIAERSIWLPINLLSAMALPALAHAPLEQLRAFDAWGLGLGIVIHGFLSAFVGLLYAVLLPMLPRRPILWGGIVGPVLWTAVIWSCLEIVNPTLLAHIDWTWFIASQVAFGVTAGVVIARSQPIATMQSWSLPERAGIEASGGETRGEREE